jgi:gliding motility-associated-like protein
MEPLTPSYSAFNITQEKVFRPDTLRWNRIYKPYCQVESKEIPLQIDTILACNASWKVTLPGDEYIWWDNYPYKERNISIPGIYKAYKLSCTNPGVYLFTLKKNGCDCPLFIPNAFSPNNDGINDIVEIYSSCEIINYQWKIYSRWGNLIDNGMNDGWTGIKSGVPLPQDTYLLVINYKIKDIDGKLQEGQQVQILSLIR